MGRELQLILRLRAYCTYYKLLYFLSPSMTVLLTFNSMLSTMTIYVVYFLLVLGGIFFGSLVVE